MMDCQIPNAENHEPKNFYKYQIIAALIDQIDYQTVRKYWNNFTEMLKTE